MAYVLAGGRGSRLMELTDRRAKPAVYFGGKIAHHRFRAVERAQFRHPPHRGRDAVQGPQPDPPSAARLELLPPRAQRELRHPAGLAARFRDDVVSRHRRRGLSEHRHHRELRAAIHGHPGRRPHLQDGLREDAAAARRVRRRRDGRLPRGAAARKPRASASCTSTRRTASCRFLEKPKNPPPMPGKPDVALASMGIYVFETKFLIERAASATPPIPNSSHDFGKDIIPYLVANGKAVAHHFSRSCVRLERRRRRSTGATSARSTPIGRPTST